MQTINQRNALKGVGQLADHNPAHYRFARTVSGFYPEPDSPRAERVVVWVAAGIAVVLVLLRLFGVDV